MTPLMVAVKGNYPEMVRFLLERGANVRALDQWDHSAMKYALHFHNRGEIVEMLLEFGFDPNENCSSRMISPLNTVCSNNMYEYIPILLKAGANVNPSGKRSPLHTAAYNNSVESIQLLIEAGANINASSWCGTPLDEAIEYNSLEAERLLIQAGGLRSSELATRVH